MNPITLYHGQSESGVMKVKFSIVSSVKRKIMAHSGPPLDTGQDSSTEEIYAAVSEPLVQHFEADCARLENLNAEAIANSSLDTCLQQIHKRKQKIGDYKPTEAKQIDLSHASVKGEILLPQSDPPALDTIEVVRATAVPPSTHLLNRKLSDSKEENISSLEQIKSLQTTQNNLPQDQVDPPVISTPAILCPTINTSSNKRSTLETKGRDLHEPQLNKNCDRNKLTVEQSVTLVQLEICAKKTPDAYVMQKNISVKQKLSPQEQTKQSSVNPKFEQSKNSELHTPVNIHSPLNLPKVKVSTPLILSKLNENIVPSVKTLSDLSQDSDFSPSPKLSMWNSLEDIPFADSDDYIDENQKSYFQVSEKLKQEVEEKPTKFLKSRKLQPLPLCARTRYNKSKKKTNKRLNQSNVPLSPVKEEMGDSFNEIEEMAAIYEDANDSFEQLLASAEDSLLISPGHSSENNSDKIDLNAFVGAAPLATEDDYDDDLDEFFLVESKILPNQEIRDSVNTLPLDLPMDIKSVKSKNTVDEAMGDFYEKVTNLSISSDGISDPESSQSSENKESTASSSESIGNYGFERSNMDYEPHHKGTSKREMESSGLSETKNAYCLEEEVNEGNGDEPPQTNTPNLEKNHDHSDELKAQHEKETEFCDIPKQENSDIALKAHKKGTSDQGDLAIDDILDEASDTSVQIAAKAFSQKKETAIENESGDDSISNLPRVLDHNKAMDENFNKMTEIPHPMAMAQNKKEAAIDDESDDEDTGFPPSKILTQSKKETAIDDDSDDEDTGFPPSKVLAQSKKETAVDDDSDDIGFPPSTIFAQSKKETAIDDDSDEIGFPPQKVLAQNKKETAIDDYSDDNDIGFPPQKVLAQNKKETAIDDYSDDNDIGFPPQKVLAQNKKETAIDDYSDDNDFPLPKILAKNKKETAIDDDSNDEDTGFYLPKILAKNKKETAIDDNSDKNSGFPPSKVLTQSKKESAIDYDSDDNGFPPPKVLVENRKEINKKESAMDSAMHKNESTVPLMLIDTNKEIDDKENFTTQADLEIVLGRQGKESPKLMHLDKYHLKKHDEMMQLSSSRSVFKTPPASPAVIVYPLTTDGLPPLPDTTEVPSVSDTEGRQRLEKQMWQERAQSSRSLDQNQGSICDNDVQKSPSSIVTSDAGRSWTGRKRWVPKRDRERRRPCLPSDKREGNSRDGGLRTPTASHAEKSNDGIASQDSKPGSERYDNVLKTKKMDRVVNELKDIQGFEKDQKQETESLKILPEENTKPHLHQGGNSPFEEKLYRSEGGDDSRVDDFPKKDHTSGWERNVKRTNIDLTESIGYGFHDNGDEKGRERKRDKDKHDKEEKDHGGGQRHEGDRKRPETYKHDSSCDSFDKQRDGQNLNSSNKIERDGKRTKDCDYDIDGYKYDDNRKARRRKDRHRDRSFDHQDEFDEKPSNNRKEMQKRRNRSLLSDDDFDEEDKFNRKLRHKSAEDRDIYKKSENYYGDEDKHNRKVRHKRGEYRSHHDERFRDDGDEDKYEGKRHKRDKYRSRHGGPLDDSDELKYNSKNRHEGDDRDRNNRSGEHSDERHEHGRKSRHKKGNGQHFKESCVKEKFKENQDKRDARDRQQERKQEGKYIDDEKGNGKRLLDSNVTKNSEFDFTLESKSQAPVIFVTERDESLDSYSKEIESVMEPNVITVDRFLRSVPDIDRSGSPRLSRRRGGAIAPDEQKQDKRKRAQRTRSEPRGDYKHNTGLSPKGGSSQVSTLRAAVLTRSNTSLASNQSRRSRSESPRIFENCPEVLPPKPQIDPLTGEPFRFVHPLMAQSVESLRSLGNKQESSELASKQASKESYRDSTDFRPNLNLSGTSQEERKQKQSDADIEQQKSSVFDENAGQIKNKSHRTWKSKNKKGSFKTVENPINQTKCPDSKRDEHDRNGAKLRSDVHGKEIFFPGDVSDNENASSHQEKTTPKLMKTSLEEHTIDDETLMDKSQDLWKPKQRSIPSSKGKKYRPEETSSVDEAHSKHRKQPHKEAPDRKRNNEFDDDSFESEQPQLRRQNIGGMRRQVDSIRDDTKKAALKPLTKLEKFTNRELDKGIDEPFMTSDPKDFTIGHEDFKPDQDKPVVLPSKNKRGLLSRLSCVGGKSKESMKHAEKSKGRMPVSRQVEHYEEGEKKKIEKISKDKDQEEKRLWYFQNDEDLQTGLSNTNKVIQIPDSKLMKQDLYEKQPDSSGQRYLSTFSDPVSAIEPFLEEKKYSPDQGSAAGSLQMWNTGRMTPVLEESSASSFKSSKKEESEHGLFKSFGKGNESGCVDSTLNSKDSTKKEKGIKNATYIETDANFMCSSLPPNSSTTENPQPKQWKSKSARNQSVSDESGIQDLHKSGWHSPTLSTAKRKGEQSKNLTLTQDDSEENFTHMSGEVKSHVQKHFSLNGLPKQPAEIKSATMEKKVHKNIFGPAHEEHETSFDQSASFEPSASFDSADGFERLKPRAFSFDENYIRQVDNPLPDLALVQGAAMGVKRRVSIASTESSSLKGFRSRSNSTTSNPLTYEPWRAKAKRRSRSMSISELMTARGAPRNSHHPPRSRSRSFSEIPHAYSSTVANSVARRRSRTQAPQELSPRMYQPRPRSRSRGSLGDTSLGCGAAPTNQQTTGILPSNTGACLADSAGYLAAAAAVKRSESERQPFRMVEDPERKNVERSKSDRRQQLIEQNPTPPSKSDTLRSTDSASGGETLEERSSKEGSPTKEQPSPTKEKKKKKKFRIPSFSKKKNKESKESAI